MVTPSSQDQGNGQNQEFLWEGRNAAMDQVSTGVPRCGTTGEDSRGVFKYVLGNEGPEQRLQCHDASIRSASPISVFVFDERNRISSRTGAGFRLRIRSPHVPFSAKSGTSTYHWC